MPWVEMLETAMRETAPDELRIALGDDAPELARIVPQLCRVLPDIPPPLEIPPELQRRYVFNSFRECVTRLSIAQPRLYVLEDLHWADESTLLLLEHLAERLARIPCLVMGTYRDPPSDVSPQLADTLSGLVRGRQARLLSLRRHSEEEVEALLRALSGQTPPSGVRTAVYGETQGNAFFVEEVFRHLAESGRLLDDCGRFRDDLAIGELDVPDNVRLVTGRRLERLSEPTQRVLAVAAVAGRHVADALLDAITDIHGDDLIDALEEAERARLIVTETVGHREEYWFGHELIRQTLLTRLSRARRRQYHLRVADAMERIFADDLPAQAATIAQHLLDAGALADRARVFRHLVMAGRRALESAAFEDALRHLELAAARVEAAGPSDRAELLFHLGAVRRATGRWDRAIETWHEAIDLAQAAGDARMAGRVCDDAAFTLAWATRWEEGDVIAQRGLDLLGDGVSPLRARLLARRGFLQACVTPLPPFEVGDGLLREALAIADGLADASLRGACLLSVVIQRFCWMRQPECAAAALEAAELLRAAGNRWDEAAARRCRRRLRHLGGAVRSHRQTAEHRQPAAVGEQSSEVGDIEHGADSPAAGRRRREPDSSEVHIRVAPPRSCGDRGRATVAG
jgi:tetratricopeptide (TPR) repeat protein